MVIFKTLTELADFINDFIPSHEWKSRIELEADLEQFIKERQY